MKWTRGPAGFRRLAPRVHPLLLPATVGGKAVALGAVAILAAGSASLTIYGTIPRMPATVTQPQLTANTNASCNKVMPKGYMRCFAIVRTPADHQITADQSGPPSTALTPADIQSAYKLPSATAGSGQTVAVVDAGDDPTAESDLAVFRSQYGLPPCTTANGCFKKVNQEGQARPLPPELCGGSSGCWPVEESLDLDAISSACPNCNILLVEADDNANANLEAAVNEAVTQGAKFVSNSYGGPETPSETTTDDPAYNHPGVAVTASAGDDGYGVNYPSASQYVTAVGGTTLTKDSSVPRGWDETVWNHSGNGTGSGCSQYEPQPSSQQGIPQLDAVCQNRATADVSADADPASGLAVYDTTGASGWLQIGGTSLASPLIAATYALAGTPAAGTYPSSYPYHDPSQSTDLNDVTSGSNGDCGNVLCTAGTGWDGPTGLGTPNGVTAFEGAPQGTITGEVTDSATGKPIASATVTAQPGDYVTHTDNSGDYTLNLTAGGSGYTLTTADYGYSTRTQTGVQVTAGQTTTENLSLTAEPSGTLTGTVTDGSGQGWPLHAQITIPGYPSGSVWTNPYTGSYSVTLPQGSYSLTVSTDYPGYQDKTIPVTVGPGTTSDKITLAADLTACTAPGYGPAGLAQGFAGWTGGTPKDGWAVSSRGGRGWRFDNPGNVTPPPHGTIPNPGDPHYHQFFYFDSDDFAVADPGYDAPRPLDTALTSPPVTLAGQKSPRISFDSAYYPDGRGRLGPARSGRGAAASVQLSTDGGHSWTTLWQQTASDAIGPVSIPVPQVAGNPAVQVRWVFTGGGFGYWAVGDVLIGTATCEPQKGGLVAGVVTDHTADSAVNGAQVADTAVAPPYPWPQGISLATADPTVPDGFYWLFAPVGSQQLSVTAPGYRTATATVTTRPGQVTRKNWALTASGGGR
jgi:hypothetical protein